MDSGHILIPYGNYGTNTGPIDVIGWRPDDNDFLTFLENVPDERIHQYRVLNDGQVWSCNTDPAFRNEAMLGTGGLDGEGWRLVECSVPDKGVAVHQFDVAQTSNGDLFATVARNFTEAEMVSQAGLPNFNPDVEYNTGFAIWRSVDGGDNWTEDFLDLKNGDGYYRPYGFGKIGDHLFVSASDGTGHWKRDGATGIWSSKRPLSLGIFQPPVWGENSFAVGNTLFTETAGVLSGTATGVYRYLWHGDEGYLKVSTDGELTYGETSYGRLADKAAWTNGIVLDDLTALIYNYATNKIHSVDPLIVADS